MIHGGTMGFEMVVMKSVRYRMQAKLFQHDESVRVL